MTIKKAIGLVITKYLSENNVSKKKLADRSKISRAYLYKIINGDASPTIETLMFLSEGMDMSLTKLITQAEKLITS